MAGLVAVLFLKIPYWASSRGGFDLFGDGMGRLDREHAHPHFRDLLASQQFSKLRRITDRYDN